MTVTPAGALAGKQCQGIDWFERPGGRFQPKLALSAICCDRRRQGPRLTAIAVCLSAARPCKSSRWTPVRKARQRGHGWKLPGSLMRLRTGAIFVLPSSKEVNSADLPRGSGEEVASRIGVIRIGLRHWMVRTRRATPPRQRKSSTACRWIITV